MPLFKLLQLSGLLLDMIGILIIFFNSPINDNRTMMGGHIHHAKNNRLKIGLVVLLAGLACQVAGVLLQ